MPSSTCEYISGHTVTYLDVGEAIESESRNGRNARVDEVDLLRQLGSGSLTRLRPRTYVCVVFIVFQKICKAYISSEERINKKEDQPSSAWICSTGGASSSE